MKADIQGYLKSRRKKNCSGAKKTAAAAAVRLVGGWELRTLLGAITAIECYVCAAGVGGVLFGGANPRHGGAYKLESSASPRQYAPPKISGGYAATSNWKEGAGDKKHL